MKKCVVCKRMLEEEKFQKNKKRNMCKECVSLQQYNSEEFEKKYPDYLGRKKKECNCCHEVFLNTSEFFERGKKICQKCSNLQKYHPEEFKKTYPNYIEKKLYNIKFGERYSPPPPPDDIVRCLNSLDNTLSMIHVEMKSMNDLLRDILYNNR